MKKFMKILALVMAVLMLGSVMVACNNGGESEETAGETAAAVSIKVKLIVKDATGKEVYNEDVSYSGTNPVLGEVIANFCAANEYAEPFDANNMLATLGELTPGEGETWIAYKESEGKNKAFDSIMNQAVADGDTIVIAIDKL